MKVDLESKAESKMARKTSEHPDSVDPELCITFRGGVLGFPTITSYLLIEYEKGQSFFRLQAVDEPDLGFVVVDPLMFVPDYQPKFSKAELESLEISDPDLMVLLSIVSIPKDEPLKMTANLMAPLVINSRLRLGKQIVLSNSTYAIREPIMKTD